MAVMDNAQRYGLITRALHWSVAALLLWQFAGMAVKILVGRGPEWVAFMVGSHVPVGVVIALLVLLRALWAGLNARRRPHHGAGLLGAAARAGHLALYALMLVVPLIALLRLYGSGRGLTLAGIDIFAKTETQVAWMMAPANVMHSTLAWVLLALIAGHIAMVFVHQHVLKDGSAARMIGRG